MKLKINFNSNSRQQFGVINEKAKTCNMRVGSVEVGSLTNKTKSFTLIIFLKSSENPERRYHDSKWSVDTYRYLEKVPGKAASRRSKLRKKRSPKKVMLSNIQASEEAKLSKKVSINGNIRESHSLGKTFQ